LILFTGCVWLEVGLQFTQALPSVYAQAKPAFNHLTETTLCRAVLERQPPTISVDLARHERRIRMSKTSIPSHLPFYVPDISALARNLDAELRKLAAPPTHLMWLNILARCAGHRNYQSLKAAQTQAQAPHAAQEKAPVTLTDHATKALGHFDDAGCLLRWPTKFAVQRLALWGVWMHVEAKRIYTEKEITRLLAARNGFDDPVTLRRELINMKMMARKPDCSAYWKEPVRAPQEAAALMHALRMRQRQAIAVRGRGTPSFAIH
jgi:hypothetical protein